LLFRQYQDISIEPPIIRGVFGSISPIGDTRIHSSGNKLVLLPTPESAFNSFLIDEHRIAVEAIKKRFAPRNPYVQSPFMPHMTFAVMSRYVRPDEYEEIISRTNKLKILAGERSVEDGNSVGDKPYFPLAVDLMPVEIATSEVYRSLQIE
jgi:hypothetical protein